MDHPSRNGWSWQTSGQHPGLVQKGSRFIAVVTNTANKTVIACLILGGRVSK
jgi:hypothetical protein